MINGKLGKRPPSNKPALKFGDHFSGALDVVYPASAVSPAMTYPMDKNDAWGDCVVAGADHTLQQVYTLLTGSYTNWTDAQIETYYKTQNPDFDPTTDANDNGMDIQTFLEYLVKEKVILAFAKVDHTNQAEFRAATWVGLGLMIGQVLTQSQEQQIVWDYVPGEAEIGGHCTAWIGYNQTDEELVSWGEALYCTNAFISHQVDEAWLVLTQAHIDHPGFRDNFNLESFAAAYTEITGKPFPVAVTPPTPSPTPVPEPTPTPTPDPAPTPSPSPPSDETLWAEVKRLWADLKKFAKDHGLE